MKKRFVFLLHLAYWLLYSLLLLVILSIVHLQFNRTFSFFAVLILTPAGVLCFVPNLFSFYSFYFFLFPAFLRRKRIAALIVYGILICLISAVVGGLSFFILFRPGKPLFTETSEFFGFMLWMSLVAAIHGGIALVIRGFITWYGEIKSNEELHKRNYETEIALIKSQINPHFLFNTINNIDVLITRDAAKASEYLNKLSDILRYMIYETKTEKIPLLRELTYVEKYLELQRIRTANSDYVNYQVTGAANNLMIAPMIFFPFIENAFKHTENKKSANSIRIRVAIENKNLVFECENTFQKNLSAKPDYGGLGNELIAKRLMLLYPGRHQLEIAHADQIYKVHLSLDLYEN